MAHLLRPWLSYFTKSGKRVAKNTPGAKRVKERARKWYAAALPGWPKGKRVPLCADKSVAQQMLADLLRKAERQAAGLTTPEDEHGKRPLDEHLDDYRRYLSAKGNTTAHVRVTISRCRALLTGIGAQRFDDLSPSAVIEWLAALRRDDAGSPDPAKEWYAKAELVALLGINAASLARILQRDGLEGVGHGKARRYSRAVAVALHERLRRGHGIATTNHYLVALKSFTHWLVRERRLAADPLAGLSKMNEEPDVRLVRRTLSPEEFAAFLNAARQGKTLRCLTGEDRAVLYQLAARSGLRASELASLTPASFDFVAPFVVVEAGYSKRRRRDEQPLPADVAAMMRAYCEGRDKDSLVWPAGWVADAAELIRHDLAEAGLSYVDAEGKTFDFHALRHQFITDMVDSGVHPKDAQALARHSTITLTMNRYAHVRPANLHAALNKLPKLTDAGQENDKGTATG